MISFAVVCHFGPSDHHKPLSWIVRVNKRRRGGAAKERMMMSKKVLLNGELPDQIEAAIAATAKLLGVPDSPMLMRAASERGYGSWSDLTEHAWSLDDDGDVAGRCSHDLTGEVAVFSQVVEFPHDEDDRSSYLTETWSVNVSLHFFDPETPYLRIDFGNGGTEFQLTEEQQLRFASAVETGSQTDLVATQAALVTDVLSWYDSNWIEGFDHVSVTRLVRRVIGATELVWEEPGLAGYGPYQEAIRIYDAGQMGLMVCLESSRMPTGEARSFGFISREQFDEVPHSPYNYPAMHMAFAAAAGFELSL